MKLLVKQGVRLPDQRQTIEGSVLNADAVYVAGDKIKVTKAEGESLLRLFPDAFEDVTPPPTED